MAKPPIKSVVLRTPKPTKAQGVLQAQAQQAKFAAGLPDPRAMPSRTMVSPTGATVGSAARPVPVNRRGLVPSPSNTVAALTAGVTRHAGPAPKKPQAPKVRVVVHPSGKIEVHHAAPAEPTTSAPAVKLGGEGSTDPATGRTTIGATRATPRPAHPAPAPVARAAAGPAAPVAAPQQTLEQQAQGILDPVKQSILDAINQRVTAQQSAITNYAKDLAGMMGQYGPAAGAAYSNATTGQAAIDAALAQTLQGAGASGQAGLAAKLAQIDADPGTTARITGDAAQATRGAVGAAAGRGAASLSQLLGQKANAQDYGAKLPGEAGLYGLQATKSAQSQATTDTANAIAQIEQQYPGIVQQLKSNQQAAQTAKTQQQQIRFERGAALLSANGGVVTPEIRRLLGGALPVGKTAKAKAADAAAANAKIPKVDSTLSKAYGVQTDDHGRAIVGKDGKPIPYPTGDTAAPKVNVSLSKIYGVLVDNEGSPILHQGKPVELPSDAKSDGGALHGLSKSTYQTKQAKAAGLARIAHEPTADGHPGVSWQQYLTGALKQGIPWWIVIQEGKRVYTPAEIKLGLIPGQKK